MPSLKPIDGIVIVIIILLCVCLYFGCDEKNPSTQTNRIDTVYVPYYVEIPAVNGSGIAEQQKPYQTRIAVKATNNDTTISYDLSKNILELLAQRDSLNAQLENQKISIPVTLCETIKGTGDSICIQYDEVSRKLDYSIRFVPRKIDVPHIKETIIEEITLWEKIGYGIIGAATAIVCVEVL